jgi:hypothetical protein
VNVDDTYCGVHATGGEGSGIFVERKIDYAHSVALTCELGVTYSVAVPCSGPELSISYQTETLLSRQPTATCSAVASMEVMVSLS